MLSKVLANIGCSKFTKDLICRPIPVKMPSNLDGRGQNVIKFGDFLFKRWRMAPTFANFGEFVSKVSQKAKIVDTRVDVSLICKGKAINSIIFLSLGRLSLPAGRPDSILML